MAKKKEFNPGQRLMRARQRQRLTRKDVARRLSLGTRDIKAIDQWDLSALTPHTNVHKAVRQYALLVGQKPSYFENYVPKRSDATYRDKRIITLSKTSVSLIGIILALVAGGFIAWRTYVANAAPFLVVTEPRDGSTVHMPKIPVSGETNEQAQVIINGINTPVGPDGTFNGEAVLSNGPNTIEVRSINSFGRENVMTRTVHFNPDT